MAERKGENQKLKMLYLVQNFSRMAIFDIFASFKFDINFLLRFKT